MIGLRKDFDVAIQCAILNDTEIVFLERIRSGSFVELDFTTGSRAPVYCTALGKALLAFMDKAEALKIIDKIEFAPQTPSTITEKGHFIKELELTKQRGYAFNNQELVLGLKSYAVPVFNGNGVEGAFGATFRINREQPDGWEKTLIERMLDIAQKSSI